MLRCYSWPNKTCGMVEWDCFKFNLSRPLLLTCEPHWHMKIHSRSKENQSCLVWTIYYKFQIFNFLNIELQPFLINYRFNTNLFINVCGWYYCYRNKWGINLSVDHSILLGNSFKLIRQCGDPLPDENDYRHIYSGISSVLYFDTPKNRMCHQPIVLVYALSFHHSLDNSKESTHILEG